MAMVKDVKEVDNNKCWETLGYGCPYKLGNTYYDTYKCPYRNEKSPCRSK